MTEAILEDNASEPETEEAQYAIVEICGHRKHVGRVSEVSKFGGVMLRVDYFDCEDGTDKTAFYSSAALFGISYVGKAYVDDYVDTQKRRYRPYSRGYGLLLAPEDAEEDDSTRHDDTDTDDYDPEEF